MTDPQINSTEELRAILDRISFANSTLNFKWKFRSQPVVFRLREGNWLTPTGINGDDDRYGWIIFSQFERPDIVTGKIGIGRGRDEIVWRGTTESGVAKTAWVLFDMMIRHEMLEGFKLDGIAIFNPHHSVRQLQSLSKVEAVDTYNLAGAK